ncbi:MAG: lytic transglycosylase domain-containing protein [Rhodobacteraceae bacterium]|nr:lytic transglycosylase domain-containing protein [Paracoccaceae bacterium]
MTGAAALCDRAIVEAAARHGTPLRLMRAVALVESGKKVTTEDGSHRVAWPWTVNMEGAGHWFDSRAAALRFVRAAQARGARSFDVGCMQVNHLWHGDNFNSLEAMFQPVANADYAARFLRELMDETGDWMRAAGHYHSRTPSLGRAYRDKVGAAYKMVDAAPARLNDIPPPPRSWAPKPFGAAPLLDGLAAFPAQARNTQAGSVQDRKPQAAATPTRGAVSLSAIHSGKAGLLRPAAPLF